MSSDGDYEKILYFHNKHLPSFSDTIVTTGDLAEAIKDVVRDDVKCIQKCGDTWKVYLTGKESAMKLENDGFNLKDRYIKASEERTKAKLTICGLPPNNQNKINSKIIEELNNNGYEIDGEITREKIRDPITGENTKIFTGNIKVTVSWSDGKKCLPRNTQFAGYQCRIYHHGQETTRHKITCYTKVRWVCGQLDHDCELVGCLNVINEYLAFLQDKDYPLSIFFPFNNKELTKRKELVNKSRDDTELERRKWAKQMKEILEKLNQVREVRKRLELKAKKSVRAFAMDDWGPVLSRGGTLQTDPLYMYWPGKDPFGLLVKEIVFASTEKLDVYSINVGGLKSKNKTILEKRLSILNFLKQENFDIVFLQETHFTKHDFQDDDLVDTFGIKFKDFFECEHCPTDKSSTRGVSILVKKSIGMNLKKRDASKNGSWLYAEVKYKKKTIGLLNVYAPSGDTPEKREERINVFNEVFSSLQNIEHQCYIILGGDFNCKLDKEGAEGSKVVLMDVISKLHLTDAWAQYGEEEKGFTSTPSKGKNPNRIDYIFLRENFPLLNISLKKQPLLSDGSHLSKGHLGIYFDFVWA